MGGEFKINRQELPKTYIRSGEFYSFRIKDFFLKKTIFPDKMHLLKTDNNYVNIDTQEDLDLIHTQKIKINHGNNS